MQSQRVVVVGAGIAGLVAAIEIAARGASVVVVERTDGPGGKLRQVRVGDARIDAGPTVLTMRWVFDELFAAAGAEFDREVPLQRAEILARHAWSEHERLDLYGDVDRSAEAIAALAGPAEGLRYRLFCDHARAIYETLEQPFLRADVPTPLGLVRALGPRRLGELWRIRPFATLWRALGEYFHDPRLRQLFGRYATYVGSSPFLAPATLMLIAHVERVGVWMVDGGMQRIATALMRLGETHGVTFRFGADVDEVSVAGDRASGVVLATGERLVADAVVCNADVAAIAAGKLGREAARAVPRSQRAERSLSAVTWSLVAQTQGFPLLRHNVFFSRDSAAEFEDLCRRRRLPGDPTVYVCAQDRGGSDRAPPPVADRLLCLVNAPATGDSGRCDASEIDACEQRAFGVLARCGLRVERTPESTVVTTPEGFERLFPATGGALYGQASHGWRASFRRPGPRSTLRGLYLAGGSTHPGPGVPMAALSGRLAATVLLADFASTRLSLRAVTAGGTSMR